MVKSAVRALDLLELLADRGAAMTHGELAEALALPKSSLTELLAAMEARQFVRRDDGGTRFGLGPEILPLAGALLRQIDIVKLARPVLAALMEQTGESTALSVRVGRDVMVVARETCAHPVAYSLQIGQRAPLSVAAAGKALLAAAGPAEWDRYLAAPLATSTRHSLTDPRALRRQLAAIAAGGIALGKEELFEGVVTLALPLRDGDGRPAAALSVGMPAMRFTAGRRGEIEGVLRQAAGELSRWLGWRPDEAKKARGT